MKILTQEEYDRIVAAEHPWGKGREHQALAEAEAAIREAHRMIFRGDVFDAKWPWDKLPAVQRALKNG